MNKGKEIAIYGKGGIGKSTLAANLSAALSERGRRVLQIGCDPKHDSTRLLMRGKALKTVLDYIKETPVLEYDIKDVLGTGFGGAGCIEAGGPKPGVGCAGRGIITAFEFLEKFNVKERYDTVLYDVLGDVVCGGFAVPIRKEYADTVFVVTSGEYMSIYAANNILRGIKNYDDEHGRVAGILYNSRNVKGEDERVAKFAEAVGLPVFAKIPRTDVFTKAERAHRTVVEAARSENADAGTAEVAALFGEIAARICEGPALYPADPMTDEELEYTIMGTEPAAGGGSGEEESAAAAETDDAKTGSPAENSAEAADTGADGAGPADAAEAEAGAGSGSAADMMSKNVIRNEPLHGCAFNGAACMSVHIRDAVVLLHAPKSCAYLSYQTITSTGRRALYERGSVLTNSLLPNLESTDMTENDMVFGGMENLEARVREIEEKRRPRAVIVVSSCPAGIIGDDVGKVRALSTPDCPVITIKADGNLTGDYLQGMLTAYPELAKQIIDPDVPKENDAVNIVFEKVVLKNAETNFAVIKGMLDRLGVRVNCRYLYNTTFDQVKNFCAARLNLLAYDDYAGKMIRGFFEKEYGAEFFDRQFPVGFRETKEWLEGVAGYFGKENEAKALAAEAGAAYEKRIAAVKPLLEGKKLFIVTFNHEIDWILGAALDCGMQIVKIGVLNFSQDEGFRTSIPEVRALDIEEDYDREKRYEDIRRRKPDIVLGNYNADDIAEGVVADTIPMCPDVGFFSGVDRVERWAGLVGSGKEGEWQNDKELFERFYA